MRQRDDLSLEVQRVIRARPEQVFAAWTTPSVVLKWWGPVGVTCTLAELDVTVGGRYRLGNRLPDGSMIYIGGEFLEVMPPNKLVYTWGIEPNDGPRERVTVTFDAHAQGTQVTVCHERIARPSVRDQHQRGWNGCLDSLNTHLTPPPP